MISDGKTDLQDHGGHRSDSFSDSFAEALGRRDPFASDPLAARLDPLSPSRFYKAGSIRWLRLALFLAAVSSPTILLCLVDNATLSGGFFGPGGIHRDYVHFFLQWVIFPALIIFVVLGRRMVGHVIIRTEEALGRSTDEVSPRSADPPSPRLLRILDLLSHTDRMRGTLWLLVLEVFNLLFYAAALRGGHAMWLMSPARPGSAFYFLHLGSEQPNLAGLWAFLVCGPAFGYVVVMSVQVIVDFASSCRMIAIRIGNGIIPTHPDGLGGLRPIGRAALFFSAPILLLGASSAFMTLQDRLVWKTAVNPMTYLLAVIYAVAAPLLFLLPLLPLRRAMYRARADYLATLHRIYRELNVTGKEAIESGALDKADLGQQFAILRLIEIVDKMSVWPFDRQTVLRFGGFVVAPLLPVLASDLQRVVSVVLAGLGLHGARP